MIRFVLIIYNPNASSGAALVASDLARGLARERPEIGVELLGTKHAGHGADLAEIAAAKYRNALIVSVGGDGNYHDVLNGLMRVPAKQRPTVALVPAGNANDHFRIAHDGADFLERLERKQFEQRDLLKLTVYDPRRPDVHRYAHSYIGFGASGRIARALNEERPGKIGEKLIVLREMLRSKAFKVVRDGSVKSYDNIICAHINEMAKYLKLTPKAVLDDGKFEVIETPSHSRLELMRQLSQAVTGQTVQHHSTDRFNITLLSPVQAQMDGESIWLRERSTVTVTVADTAIQVLL